MPTSPPDTKAGIPASKSVLLNTSAWARSLPISSTSQAPRPSPERDHHLGMKVGPFTASRPPWLFPMEAGLTHTMVGRDRMVCLSIGLWPKPGTLSRLAGRYAPGILRGQRAPGP